MTWLRIALTEVDWINGKMLVIGKRIHYWTPVTARLVELMHAPEGDKQLN